MQNRNDTNQLKKISLACLAFTLGFHAISQNAILKGWHLLDATADGYHGISLKQAINFLKDKKPSGVIVAVMDGGLDTNHYALNGRLWRNPKETAANKKDDDHNGYVDDVFGWNFLGNDCGENVNKESQEAVRVYHQLKPKFYDRNFDSLAASKEDRNDYNLWKKTNQLLEPKPEERMGLMMIEAALSTNKSFDSLLRTEMKNPEFTAEELEEYVPASLTAKRAKMGYLRFINLLELDRDKTNRQLFKDLDDYINHQKELQFGKQRPGINFRNMIVGDDEDRMNNTTYGNADVMGGTPLHGTHVSGIIAGLPDSAKDVQGVCSSALIMTVRCVPDGDEHDKDIALGIRYAVDNGARVINMSFGKELSPHKPWVDEAIRYAARHDVLIVHASGNDAKNIDEAPDYPSPLLQDNEQAPNVITVGASGDSSLNCGILAEFTNYGPETVDVLAPGVKIYSCIPGNQYANEQGTSMSAPIVSGIAALIRSYYPKLSATQVKFIIENSVDHSMSSQKFRKPGGEKREKIALKDICKTGGIVNAFNAVKMADKMYAAINQNPALKMEKFKEGNTLSVH